ncbi:hypothetical protein [Vibrio metschnikovii]|uniref:Uncharacterized protein n=1 Tax=Vibrio metschnikovii TaxID=28172 RepID=A0A9X0RCT1_VIBME|nr:hypothetical protein [Vibrio metschnikovii]MBC5852120.1 hypothetical protein [Vibrio metschnikovii]
MKNQQPSSTTTQPEITHIWFHNSKMRVFNTPVNDRWEKQWEKLSVVSENSRSYILSNGAKAPKKQENVQLGTFAYSDEQLKEIIWHHNNNRKIAEEIKVLAGGSIELTRELEALLAKYKG